MLEFLYAAFSGAGLRIIDHLLKINFSHNGRDFFIFHAHVHLNLNRKTDEVAIIEERLILKAQKDGASTFASSMRMDSEWSLKRVIGGEVVSTEKTIGNEKYNICLDRELKRGDLAAIVISYEAKGSFMADEEYINFQRSSGAREAEIRITSQAPMNNITARSGPKMDFRDEQTNELKVGKWGTGTDISWRIKPVAPTKIYKISWSW